MPKKLIWELFLLVAGVLYVAVVLCDNVECRSFAVAYVVLAALQLVQGHRERSSGTRGEAHPPESAGMARAAGSRGEGL
jgi:hypothetical protein